MTRKIIQIIHTPKVGSCEESVIALCDDGTVWETIYIVDRDEVGWGFWDQLPRIPQTPQDK